jgi:hypothetical protein
VNRSRRLFAVALITCAAVVGLAGPSSAAQYGVTLVQLSDTLNAGEVNVVVAAVLDSSGTPAPDGTMVRFATDDDIVVPDFAGIAPHGTDGYWLADAYGDVFAFGSAPFVGDLAEVALSGPVVGIAAGPGAGYWLATDDGTVYPFGDAGSNVVRTGIGGDDDPVVGITSHGTGGWIVTAAGKVAAFGAAAFMGHATDGPAPVAGIAATDTGRGYRTVTTAGAVSAFGDAAFRGDMSARRLNKPIAGLINFGDNAYLLVGVDGGIFNFSTRPFLGSLGANPPASPVHGVIAAPGGSGYWMLTTTGELFAFGDARHVGSYWQVPTVDGLAAFAFSSLAGGRTTISASALGSSSSISQTWTDPRTGYWALAGDGRIYPFGDAAHLGNGTAGAVDVEPTPTGNGYWILQRNGEVQPLGDALPFGNADLAKLAKDEAPASLSATPSGQGYWVFTNKGRALAFGDAPHLGDMSAVQLNGPVLGSVATPSGRGYYMVASDGGIFAFGDAAFAGSMGGSKLNAPVQSLVPDADGKGYWLVASDGGIFAFDAPFKGSMGATKLNKPVVGMVRYGDGYLMVGADGGIFNFSSSPFAGSLGDKPPASPVVAVAALP